jgi:hypothetical protein
MHCTGWDIMKPIVWLLAFEYLSAFIYLDVGGGIMLKWMLGWGGMDWINVSWDRD